MECVKKTHPNHTSSAYCLPVAEKARGWEQEIVAGYSKPVVPNLLEGNRGKCKVFLIC